MLADKIERKRRASRAVYIMPKGWSLPRDYPELTHLQYTVFTYIQENANEDGNYHTNYSRISDTLHYSTGGTKNAVLRLIELKYLRPVSPYNSDVREAVFHVENKPRSHLTNPSGIDHNNDNDNDTSDLEEDDVEEITNPADDLIDQEDDSEE